MTLGKLAHIKVLVLFYHNYCYKFNTLLTICIAPSCVLATPVARTSTGRALETIGQNIFAQLA